MLRLRATGDVIDFTARLFGLNGYEAELKLIADFGLDPDKPPAAAALRKPKYPLARAFRQDELYCRRVLNDYLRLLEDWMVRYSSHSPEENEVNMLDNRKRVGKDKDGVIFPVAPKRKGAENGERRGYDLQAERQCLQSRSAFPKVRYVFIFQPAFGFLNTAFIDSNRHLGYNLVTAKNKIAIELWLKPKGDQLWTIHR